MKKRDQYKKRMLFIFVLLAGFIAFAVVSGGGLSVTKGRCIKTENDVYLIVQDNSPVQMNNTTNHKKPFKNYSTGDEILIIHGPVRETYPGQTSVHWALKLAGGSMEDIPQNIVAHLESMGWNISAE